MTSSINTSVNMNITFITPDQSNKICKNDKQLNSWDEFVEKLRQLYFYKSWITIFETKPDNWPSAAGEPTLIKEIKYKIDDTEAVLTRANFSELPQECEIVVKLT